MVKWNRRLLIQRVTTVLWYLFVHSATVLVDLVLDTANKQGLAERLKLWFIQIRAGIYTGYHQGLPQTGTTPMVHFGVVAGRLTHIKQSNWNRLMQTQMNTP